MMNASCAFIWSINAPNIPNGKAIRHLVDSDEKTKFAQGQIDVEGSAVTPKAFDGTNVFEP